MTRTLFLAAALACIGCAPAVRYSECDINSMYRQDCPSGTVCQQVSPQHTACTVVCDYERVDGAVRFLTTCEGNGARCFLGPTQSTVGQPLYFCRLPCDAQLQCPAGLGCSTGEMRDGVGLWCM